MVLVGFMLLFHMRVQSLLKELNRFILSQLRYNIGKVCEYNQEIPQPHTEYQPTAP